MAVTTGVSSLDRAKAITPPTERVSPSFANSRTNCSTSPHAMSTHDQLPSFAAQGTYYTAEVRKRMWLMSYV